MINTNYGKKYKGAIGTSLVINADFLSNEAKVIYTIMRILYFCNSWNKSMLNNDMLFSVLDVQKTQTAQIKVITNAVNELVDKKRIEVYSTDYEPVEYSKLKNSEVFYVSFLNENRDNNFTNSGFVFVPYDGLNTILKALKNKTIKVTFKYKFILCYL